MKQKQLLAKKLFILLIPILIYSPSALASWSWSVGYNNPPGSTVGLNFMHLWSNWAFEVGIGYIAARNLEDDPDTTKDESEDTAAAVGGDLDVKYIFGGGTFKPFVQVGTGYGVFLGENSGASAGLGGFFGGGGFFLGNTSGFHFYASANISNSLFFSLGLGSGF